MNKCIQICLNHVWPHMILHIIKMIEHCLCKDSQINLQFGRQKLRAVKGKGQSHKIRPYSQRNLPQGLKKSDRANKCHISLMDYGAEHGMHVASSVWPHSCGVSACRIHRQLWKTPAMWSRREGWRYKRNTLRLRCVLMALKRLSKEEPEPALPSVNTILHAFVNKESSPSVGSSTTWFTSFVTLKSWWVKSGVGIPHWAGFPSDLNDMGSWRMRS